MKTILLIAAVAAASLQVSATVITGKIVDLTGQPITSNRTVTFTLKNCSGNLPVVGGSCNRAAGKDRNAESGWSTGGYACR